MQSVVYVHTCICLWALTRHMSLSSDKARPAVCVCACVCACVCVCVCVWNDTLSSVICTSWYMCVCQLLSLLCDLLQNHHSLLVDVLWTIHHSLLMVKFWYPAPKWLRFLNNCEEWFLLPVHFFLFSWARDYYPCSFNSDFPTSPWGVLTRSHRALDRTTRLHSF